jgi:2-oxo-4-hydroxy-4-carboxy-5-ureidoimidazoline decarboxylase
MDGLGWLNAASEADAAAALFRACGCAGWAKAVAGARPYATPDALFAAAEREWAKASRADILEAFTHHPRIGDRASLRARFPTTHGWSADEQKGASSASEKVLDDLAEGNREYESRFGHIFIVCASGKTAGEMLALLRARVGNDPDDELKIAAGEQMKITRLRLEKLLNEAPQDLRGR